MRYAALVVSLLLVLPTAGVGGEVREIAGSFPIEEQNAIRIDIPVAEVEVQGIPGRSVEVEFTATCKRDHHCKEVLEDLAFESHGSRNTLRIDFVGYPKWGKGRVELEGIVRVPRNMEIEIELGVGELDIKELASDLRVELGVGEINAWVDKRQVRTITLDAGVGEAELYGAGTRVQGRRSMLVGSEVHWDEGQGEARVFLEVGVGEISVWMD